MDEIKLTHFTVEQLDYAIAMFTDCMDDLAHKMDLVQPFDGEYLKVELLETVTKEFAIAQLWRVQLENARKEVLDMDKVTDQ